MGASSRCGLEKVHKSGGGDVNIIACWLAFVNGSVVAEPMIQCTESVVRVRMDHWLCMYYFIT